MAADVGLDGSELKYRRFQVCFGGFLVQIEFLGRKGGGWGGR